MLGFLRPKPKAFVDSQTGAQAEPRRPLTIAQRRRMASRPPSFTCPRVGSTRRSRALPVVDFPHPDSPTSPSVSPGATSNDTPSTARTDPT